MIPPQVFRKDRRAKDRRSILKMIDYRIHDGEGMEKRNKLKGWEKAEGTMGWRRSCGQSGMLELYYTGGRAVGVGG